MKEPKNHRPGDGEDYDAEYCDADGDEWPCKKWRKWTASKTFRLKELEDKHELLAGSYLLTERELRETKEKLRRLELLVRGGVLLNLRDIGTGSITETVIREPIEVTSAEGWRSFIPGPEEYMVMYLATNGTTYENNELAG